MSRPTRAPATSSRTVPRWKTAVALLIALSITCHGAYAVDAVYGLPPPAVTRPSLPDLGDSAKDDLSPQSERKLGGEIMRQAHVAGDVLEDPESTEYLNQFGSALATHTGSTTTTQGRGFPTRTSTSISID